MLMENAVKARTLEEIAKKMMIAARTAPKGRGADTFVFMLANPPDIKRISTRMNIIGKKHQASVFVRDAENILCASVMVILGTAIKPLGLKKCGLCGFKNCEEKDKHKAIPCAFNAGDLGIAIGSAVSVAADHRVDNRVLYTAGLAAVSLGLLGPDVKVAYAIPLSATSKNPFFDRK